MTMTSYKKLGFRLVYWKTYDLRTQAVVRSGITYGHRRAVKAANTR